MHDESTSPYLLASRPSERDRIQMQARVWEPAGRALLDRLSAPAGARAVDVGCGALGWLRLLSRWAGPEGTVVGTDFDPGMLDGARDVLEAEGLHNVTLMQDDVFATRLPAATFDLVHARFMITPLGRGDEQVEAYRRLARPGGHIVLEESDAGPWRVNPEAPATSRLISLIQAAFEAAGGDFSAARRLPTLLRRHGLEPELSAHVVAIAPGHPYLRMPLQFAISLRPRIEALLAPGEFDALIAQADAELSRPDAWGTSFMVVQAHVQLPT